MPQGVSKHTGQWARLESLYIGSLGTPVWLFDYWANAQPVFNGNGLFGLKVTNWSTAGIL